MHHPHDALSVLIIWCFVPRVVCLAFFLIICLICLRCTYTIVDTRGARDWWRLIWARDIAIIFFPFSPAYISLLRCIFLFTREYNGSGKYKCWREGESERESVWQKTEIGCQFYEGNFKKLLLQLIKRLGILSDTDFYSPSDLNQNSNQFQRIDKFFYNIVYLRT